MTNVKQLIFQFPFHPELTDENFVVSSSNKLVYEYLLNWPNWSDPFFTIYGPEGCGKTHLAHIWAKYAGASFLSLKELFQTHPGDYINSPIVLETKPDENPDFIDLSDHQQVHLFHFYNWMKEKGQFILWICRQPPAKWSIELPDLSSRLKIIPSMEIHSADDELLMGLYVKFFQDRQLIVTPKLIEELVNKGPRSYKKALFLVKYIDQLALQNQREITLPFVREILHRGII